ncbi:hypothetical protein TrLO_g9058 [Triparma laevis f. longispina]|uniref:Uncharacterized protein n=1 Tax=Triparma laevis f. longispina TaxID=1714387 RepID=A0A9W7FTE7_9STRA|nr:hypothetical protein TrLO_g9058 [Triparma laevis f. longispina]
MIRSVSLNFIFTRKCVHIFVSIDLRKSIAGFTLGIWQSTIGEHGLWPTSLKNLSELASREGFNEYFQKHFNGNEEPYLRWKKVFDVLEIGNARDVGPDLPLERQVLSIMRSEDIVKLRALAKLCSKEFFEDPPLLVVAWRRILEVLDLTIPADRQERIMGKLRSFNREHLRDMRRSLEASMKIRRGV